MNVTKIEWCNRPGTTPMTWNPIRARRTRADASLPESAELKTGTFCTRISPGCTHCYASTINKRFGTGAEYTVPNLADHEFFIDERILAEPLKRKKPATIFVGDMFDLFHEAIPQEFIAEVLRVAVKTPRHTFQFLTKRADRMQRLVSAAQKHWELKFAAHMWFGVSVEDQQRADERIPLLLRTPAAMRFLSVEPQLEAVDLDLTNALGCGDSNHKEAGIGGGMCRGVDWVICGGESGPGARPFNLAWAESLLEQCRAAGVPFFMKQVGSNPTCNPGTGHYVAIVHRSLRDRKGGDPSEWPEHLRVREFPR